MEGERPREPWIKVTTSLRGGTTFHEGDNPRAVPPVGCRHSYGVCITTFRRM